MSEESPAYKFGYADPPYIGCCGLYDHFHPDGKCWDEPDTTRHLITEVLNKQYDGWALSCKSDPAQLANLIRWADDGDGQLRLAAWVKPFHSFKPNVNPSFGWEPVLVKSPRKRDRYEPTVKDFHSENITLKKGLTGAKPPGFNKWIIALLGVRPGIDVLHDLFPGTGGMEAAQLELGTLRFANQAGGKE